VIDEDLQRENYCRKSCNAITSDRVYVCNLHRRANYERPGLRVFRYVEVS